MSYAALPESLRLIAGAPVAGAERLTRRRHFLPVAVDVDDDIAVTVFLRRTHGGAEWQSHVLLRTRGEWQLLGGGGLGPDDLDVLTRVPTAAESSVAPRPRTEPVAWRSAARARPRAG